MSKEFYSKVVKDLEAIKKRKVSNAPVTLKELQEFKQDAIEMLQIVNGSKEVTLVPTGTKVKMTTQKGFTTGRYELKLNKLINKIK